MKYFNQFRLLDVYKDVYEDEEEEDESEDWVFKKYKVYYIKFILHFIK